MKIKRIIPTLLLRNRGLVKTVKFRDSVYVGDPINTVRIFNEKEVDEIFFLDIDATNLKKEPPYDLIQDIASECFMPFAYGGGINSLSQIERIIKSGAEKIIINSGAFAVKNLIEEAVRQFGSSTIAVSIDVKKEFLRGYIVYINGGKLSTGKNPVEYAIELENKGVGEILVNSVDRDGTMEGYDLDLIKSVSRSVRLPVIACGGAGKMSDFGAAFTEGGASAVAAGSFFVFHGKRRAVLITYPDYSEISQIFC
jgi:imidazole glycerol-phosphate synthase subunit HisF